MSLATRCTSCGTIFRVVQDQLKVSEGWVRCGRCDAVFSAVEALFDLEREGPPPWVPPSRSPDVPPQAAHITTTRPQPDPAAAAPRPGMVPPTVMTPPPAEAPAARVLPEPAPTMPTQPWEAPAPDNNWLAPTASAPMAGAGLYSAPLAYDSVPDAAGPTDHTADASGNFAPFGHNEHAPTADEPPVEQPALDELLGGPDNSLPSMVLPDAPEQHGEAEQPDAVETRDHSDPNSSNAGDGDGDGGRLSHTPPPLAPPAEGQFGIASLLTREDPSHAAAPSGTATAAEAAATAHGANDSTHPANPLVWRGPEFDDDTAPASGPTAAPALAPASSVNVDIDLDALPPTSVEMPRFVAEAERAARWRRPVPRALLSLLALALLALLAGQAALQQRDLLAQRWPEAQPLLQAACEPLGCRIGLPRRIDDLVVESSALSPATAPNGALKLTVGLRNRGEFKLALPSVDLQLTDASGQLITRRALSADDAGPPRSVAIAGGAEAQLQWVFTTPGARVSGYTVEVFYP